jgi:hypothetical protein
MRSASKASSAVALKRIATALELGRALRLPARQAVPARRLRRKQRQEHRAADAAAAVYANFDAKRRQAERSFRQTVEIRRLTVERRARHIVDELHD